MSRALVVIFVPLSLIALTPVASASYLPVGSGGNIGIGTTTASEKLEVVGTVRATAFKGDGSQITYQGLTAGYIPQATAATTLADSVIYQAGGNIGIGTIAPAYELEVDGQIYATGAVGSAVYFYTNVPGVPDFLLPASGGSWGAIQNDAAGTWSLAHKAAFDATLGTPVLTWTNAGRVGIGTSAPAYRLDVQGGDLAIGTGTPTHLTTAGDAYITGNLQVDGDVYLGDALADNLVVAGNLYLAGDTIYTGPVAIHETNVNAFAVRTDNGVSTIFRVDTSNAQTITLGNVGIGTSVPGSALAVGATSQFQVSSGGAITAATGIASSGTINFSTLSPSLVVFTDGSENLVSVGTVSVAQGGTGAVTLTGILKGNGTSAFTALTGTPGYATRWADAETLGDSVIYDSGTNIGIGSVVPRSKLDVAGDIYASGSVTGGTLSIATGSITDLTGAISFGNENLTTSGTLQAGAGTLTSLDVTDGNITNVGDIALDTISSDAGTTIGIVLGTDAGDDLLVGTDKLVVKGDTGNIGIGSTAPQQKLDVEGSVYVGIGNVGIGSVAPREKLDVDGSIYASGSVTGGTLSIVTGSITDATGAISFANENLTTTGTLSAGAGTLTSLYVSSGNIGIGSSAPGYRLDIQGGDLAIGTGTPAHLTDEGDAYITGNLQVDGDVYLGNTIFDNLVVAGDLTLVGETNNTGSVTITVDDANALLVEQADGDDVFQVDTLTGDTFTLGNVGIGSTDPRAKLDVIGAMHVTGLVIFDTALTVPNGGTGATTLTGILKGNGATAFTALTGTPGYATRWADATTLGDSVIYDDGTNVGIGTSAPGGKLVVYGGNVGIGTVTPNAVLDVRGEFGSVGEVYVKSSASHAFVSVDAPVVSESGFAIYKNAVLQWEMLMESSSSALDFWTSGAGGRVLSLKNDGNVGIGSTAPRAKLDVEGSVYVGIGNVGIGSVAPREKLDVDGNIYASGSVTGGTLSIATGSITDTTGSISFANENLATTGTLQAGAGALTSLYVSSGNIGIGSSEPGYRLDIQGGDLAIGTGTPTHLTTEGDAYITGNLQVDGDVYLGNTIFDNLVVAGDLTLAGESVSTGAVRITVDDANAFLVEQADGDDVFQVNTLTGALTLSTALTVPNGGTGATTLTGILKGNGAAAFTALTGTPGYVTRWADATTLGDSVIYDSGTNIGIGSAVPAQKLDVTGSIYVSGNIGIGTAQPQDKFEVRDGDLRISSSQPQITFADTDAGTSLPIGLAGTSFSIGGTAAAKTFYFRNLASSGISMTLDTTGNVGIGSVAPRAILDIQGGDIVVGTGTPTHLTTDGDAYITGNLQVDGDVYLGNTIFDSLVVTGAVTFDTALTVPNGGTGATSLTGVLKGNGTSAFTALTGTPGYGARWADATTLGDAVIYDNGTNVGIGTTAPGGKLIVYGGNVGIGSTLPAYTLDVTGTGRFTSNLAVGGSVGVPNGLYFLFGAGASNITGLGNNAGADYLKFQTAYTDQMYINNAGNVGISSNAPQAKLDVEGSVYVGIGNVGIGSVAPAQKLDVLGNVYVNGNIGIGTSSPAAALQLGSGQFLVPDGSQAAPAIAMSTNPDTGLYFSGSAIYMVLDGDTLSPRFALTATDVTLPNIRFNDGNNASITNVSNADLSLGANSSEVVRISSLGNVGIGSTAPRAKFDVRSGDIVVGTGTPTHLTTEADAYITGNLQVDGDVYLGDTLTDNLVVAGSLTLAGSTTYTGPVSIKTDNANAFLVEQADGDDVLQVNTLTGALTLSTALTVPNGGTGATSLTGVIKGNGTSAFTALIGTPGYVTRWADADTLGSSVIYDSGTNIGIGSSAPQAKLDVEGNVYVGNGNVGIGSSNPEYALVVSGTEKVATLMAVNYVRAGGNTAAAPAFTAYSDAATGAFFPAAGHYGLATGGVDRLHIDSAGSVGLGSSAPQAKLDVEGNIYVGNGNIGIGTSAPEANLEISDPNLAQIILRDTGAAGTNGKIFIYSGGSEMVEIGHDNAGPMAIQINNSSNRTMSFTQDPNDAMLSVGMMEFTPEAHFEISLDGIGVSPFLMMSSSDDANGDMLILTSTGNLGLGSTAPQAKLDVEGSAYFGNGNIGVGSFAPSQKVDVIGTVKATAFIGDGAGLTNVPGEISGLSVGYLTKGLTATSIDSSAVYQSAGSNIGIGSTAPQSKLDVVGTVTALAFSTGVSSDPNYFIGNVGIGSTDPRTALDVNGAILGTTFNRVTITAPATGSTLTIADTKTLTANNTLTLAGVDGKTLTVNNSLALTGADSKTLNIGANNLTFTTTADTNITLPTTGTLVSSDVTTLSSLVNISTGLTGVVKATSGALTTMTGTPGYSARWTDANTLGNAVIYDNGTNVGIGSSAPQAKLDVEGSAYFGNGNVGIGTSAATGKLEVLGGGTTTGVTFRTRDSTGAVRVTVLDNGNVGIGTTAPVGALEVSGRVAVTPSAVTNITAVGGVTVTSGVMRIQGSGGAVNITADPQISAGTDGEILILIGQSNVNTVRFDDGAGMQIAGGTSFTMGLYDTLQLVYDAGTGFWVEVGRSNN